LAERLGPRKGSKPWDIALLGTLGISQLARYVVAGLDHRYGWTQGIPVGAQWVALLIGALGYALVVWATASNAFFSQIVRIQPERGHTVASGGPYRYVRHPAYLGSILYELTAPILFASWWSFIPGALGAIVLIVRTALEDCTLRAELPGYDEYACHVRARLLPGLW
jgi:protein-S-isoprenylcysteine O-methyltransferase Ste14